MSGLGGHEGGGARGQGTAPRPREPEAGRSRGLSPQLGPPASLQVAQSQDVASRARRPCGRSVWGPIPAGVSGWWWRCSV